MLLRKPFPLVSSQTGRCQDLTPLRPWEELAMMLRVWCLHSHIISVVVIQDWVPKKTIKPVCGEVRLGRTHSDTMMRRLEFTSVIMVCSPVLLGCSPVGWACVLLATGNRWYSGVQQYPQSPLPRHIHTYTLSLSHTHTHTVCVWER